MVRQHERLEIKQIEEVMFLRFFSWKVPDKSFNILSPYAVTENIGSKIIPGQLLREGRIYGGGFTSLNRKSLLL